MKPALSLKSQARGDLVLKILDFRARRVLKTEKDTVMVKGWTYPGDFRTSRCRNPTEPQNMEAETEEAGALQGLSWRRLPSQQSR